VTYSSRACHLHDYRLAVKLTQGECVGMLDTFSSLALLGVAGIFAGYVNAIAGGGSLLTMPLMIFMGMDGATANGTNRLAIVAQNVSSLAAFRSKGYSDIKASLRFSAGVLPGALIGALAGLHVTGRPLNLALATVMLLVLYALKEPRSHARGKPIAPARTWSPRQTDVAMLAIGFYGGFLQAGVGFLLMAVLRRATGLDLVRINMYKVFVVLVFTLAALPVFALGGKILWIPALVLALGNAAGGWLGSHAQIKRGEKFVKRVLKLMLIAMAAKLLWAAVVPAT